MGRGGIDRGILLNYFSGGPIEVKGTDCDGKVIRQSKEGKESLPINREKKKARGKGKGSTTVRRFRKSERPRMMKSRSISTRG